jgi:site-specific DNA-methyltransferase (adenine-specific)
VKNDPLPRLDTADEVRRSLFPFCRLTPGQIWRDPRGHHAVGCLDATDRDAVTELLGGHKAHLCLHDPPYNLVAFEERALAEYITWCCRWVESSLQVMEMDSALYVWLGADQRNGFQPLPDFMVMMRRMPLEARSYITMRNQRGYGTLHNWMAVRQELLYYRRGRPAFDVAAEYTDIPKILRGYYKEVGGRTTENMERSRSENIRAGNVWVDVQQVFYRLEENVSGCYAQKPLKAIERIVRASCPEGGVVADFFAHSGTTLLAAEHLGRRCATADIDPVFCELTIRRLEHYRATGQLGWQNANPFEVDLERANARGPEVTVANRRVRAQTTLF